MNFFSFTQLKPKQYLNVVAAAKNMTHSNKFKSNLNKIGKIPTLVWFSQLFQVCKSLKCLFNCIGELTDLIKATEARHSQFIIKRSISTNRRGSYLLFHHGRFIIGVKKFPLLPQWVVLKPWPRRTIQRQQRGTFFQRLFLFPLRAFLPLRLSLQGRCGGQSRNGCCSHHRRFGLLFWVPV